MKWLNTNAIHNYLNLIGLLVGVLVLQDFTQFGLDPKTAATISAGLLVANNAIKILMNINRDGVAGLVKVQPPVEKK